MCKFCSKISLPKIFLIGAIVISLGLIFGTINSLKYLPRITPVFIPQINVNAIEISEDAKSVLNAETKEVIFNIADTQKYLKDSGYFYNPDTFQTSNAKYAGDCFLSATLSNNKDRIVFSTGCLPGDLPQAWVGIYHLPPECQSSKFRLCKVSAPWFNFLIGGSGRNFVWSADDKTITYEADLGLSGMMETRTIDSGTGEILEKKNDQINNNQKPPHFEDFPVSEKFNGLPAKPDFSTNPNASEYITRITEGAKKGPNFAGHYTIIEWGCGTNCKTGILVDAKNGTIYSSRFLSEFGIKFQINSNLLIVNPPEEIRALYPYYPYENGKLPDWLYSQYYKWENNKLIFINKFKNEEIKEIDWKTYRNEEYGFEIKYPNNFSFFENKSYFIVSSFPPGGGTISPAQLHITVKEDVNYDDLVKGACFFRDGQARDNCTSITIDNITGTKADEVYAGKPDMYYSIDLPFKNGVISFDVNTNQGNVQEDGSNKLTDFSNIFNIIISTFKFIK